MSGYGLSDIGDFYYYQGANKFSLTSGVTCKDYGTQGYDLLVGIWIPSDTNHVTYVGTGGCILGGDSPRTYLVQLCDSC